MDMAKTEAKRLHVVSTKDKDDDVVVPSKVMRINNKIHLAIGLVEVRMIVFAVHR